jgi:hypothetical protein
MELLYNMSRNVSCETYFHNKEMRYNFIMIRSTDKTSAMECGLSHSTFWLRLSKEMTNVRIEVSCVFKSTCGMR